MNISDIWVNRALVYNNLDWVNKRDFLNFFIELCKPRSDFVALDVGCGTGIVTRELSLKVKKVIGIDLSMDMIKRAIQNGERGDPNLKPEYIYGDARCMIFPDSNFDLVTARMSFHHIDNVTKAMEEVYRVLKEGGRFILCEGVPPDHKTRQRYEEIFALKEKRHTFSEAELINMFHWVGFKNIILAPFFMKQVSLVNWLKNSAIEDGVAQRILELHLTSDEHFKRVYRMAVNDNDILIDWKFVIVRGEKSGRDRLPLEG